MAWFLRRATTLRPMLNISKGNSFTSGWKHIHHGQLTQGDSKVLSVNIVLLLSQSPSMKRVGSSCFLIKPFTKYKDVNDYCKTHVQTQWDLQNLSLRTSTLRTFQWTYNFTSFRKNQLKKVLSLVVSCVIFLAHMIYFSEEIIQMKTYLQAYAVCTSKRVIQN